MDTLMPFRNGQEADRPAFDVSDVLLGLVERMEPYAMRRGVLVEVDAPPYAMVSADPARMRQVFSQLLTLAIDATPPGGDVIVTAYHEEEGIEVEFAEGGAEMIDAPGTAADSLLENAASAKRLVDVRRLLTAEGLELEVRDCADGAKAYILQLGRPGSLDAESLRAA